MRVCSFRPRAGGAALLVGALVSSFISPHAEARRFGGGGSIGLHRSVELPKPSISPRPAMVERAPVRSFQESGTPHLDSAASAALAARRASIEAMQIAAARQRIMHAQRTQGEGATPPPVGARPAQLGGANTNMGGTGAALPATSSDALLIPDATPSVRSARPADPHFGKFSSERSAAPTPCVIKPVMSDDDYRACDATPPQR